MSVDVELRRPHRADRQRTLVGPSGAAVLSDLEAPLGDLDCDGFITTVDLLALLANWGPCSDCELPNGCPADLDLDCTVGLSDLLILLGNWG